jgi:hypothetical protein
MDLSFSEEIVVAMLPQVCTLSHGPAVTCPPACAGVRDTRATLPFSGSRSLSSPRWQRRRPRGLKRGPRFSSIREQGLGPEPHGIPETK